LYGAFGYDLTFQFEPIKLKHERSAAQRDLVLYLPDQIIVVDAKKKDAWELRYDFSFEGATTNWQARAGADVPFALYPGGPEAPPLAPRDTAPGAFSGKVKLAKQEFKVGNLFEVVLSQTFVEPLHVPPSTLFRRLRKRNPAPYGFLLNLGQQEYLVGASPEMFVRCEQTPLGLRVETCPISGTIARGADALEDAQRIAAILANPKEESELTMCTDVDRNDKSRVCVPGSVRVVGRRQIELYSRLIHTVDHVEGYLRPGFDALDAFLCHTWAVTVTGAPKTWAMRFVEQHEESPREWYGGAVGLVGFDGHLNTGLTLRTVHVKGGVGAVRAGATLLFDSDPAAEERETELKASAMLDALVRADPADDDSADAAPKQSPGSRRGGGSDGEDLRPPRVLLIDHEDSFVHTLANYLRQTGAEVRTRRSGAAAMAVLDAVAAASAASAASVAAAAAAAHSGGSAAAAPDDEEKEEEEVWTPDLVVLSPGPGNPTDFGLSATLDKACALRVPVFGVCLGLQGICEHFGGKLGVLEYPMHGKPSAITLTPEYAAAAAWPVFAGLPPTFDVARYHSLHAVHVPPALRVTARTADGVVMALEHTTLPIAAVQFHPESILTNPSYGLTILSNCLNCLAYAKK
jgi:anthranilate synthase